MVKAVLKTSISFICVILFVVGCSKNPSTSSENFEEYSVRIINESLTEISDVIIEMVGSDDITKVSKISNGEALGCITFKLPVLEGEMGRSWGDYYGYYTHNGSIRDFFIYNYEHEFKELTTIKIDSESYKTEFTNSLDDCFPLD